MLPKISMQRVVKPRQENCIMGMVIKDHRKKRGLLNEFRNRVIRNVA